MELTQYSSWFAHFTLGWWLWSVWFLKNYILFYAKVQFNCFKKLLILFPCFIACLFDPHHPEKASSRTSSNSTSLFSRNTESTMACYCHFYGVVLYCSFWFYIYIYIYILYCVLWNNIASYDFIIPNMNLYCVV